MTTKRYEFQPPTNIDAIRSSIIQRIKDRSSANKDTSSSSPLTPPPQSDEYDKKLPFLLHLDNGLPSPPIETCCYEEDQLPTEMVVNALMELSPVAAATTATATATVDSSQVIRERIRLLKEEKHKLFQAMKDLLSTPSSASASASAAPLLPPPPQQQQQQQSSPVTITTRPVARSRSISHTDTTTRPISRYYDRPRFYNNSNTYYPYQPSTISSSSTVRNT
ncbi:hypothetical protein HPULCUR_007611 [Helicostylum pulchrum]|uniref:Uncharacterized protein n=1 Tax=Helicostylum pulchrum TaxID=562976 RepID=A0ABP9Y610_9FUNG